MTAAILVNVHARHGSEDIGRRIQRIVPTARVAVTQSFENARAWVANEIARNRPDVLRSGGGDGTAVALLHELRDQRLTVPAFGLLPLGTGNGWARATGVTGVKSALQGLATLRDDEAPIVKTFHLVETEGKLTPFAGTGWDAEILSDYKKMLEPMPESVRLAAWGTFGYLRSILTRTVPRQISGSRPSVRVVNLGEPALAIDPSGKPVPVPNGGPGAVLYEGPLSVAGASTTEELGLGFRAFRFAHSVPGRIAVRVYAASALHATFRAPLLWRGAHPLPHDYNWMVTHCRMEFDRAVPFEIGGDLAGDRTSVELAIAKERAPLVDWAAMRQRR